MAEGTLMNTASAAEGDRASTKSGKTIRAYEVGDYTHGLAVHMVQRPAPVAGYGEVVINVRATGLNARDLTAARGVMTAVPIPFNRIPLTDNAGDVLALGPGVTRVKVGDRVTMTHYWQWLDGHFDNSMTKDDFSMTRDGFLAEQVVVPAEPLVKIPDSMSYEEACTLQSAALTAWNAVVEGGCTRSSDVVVTLGTGGVSVFGMQFAKMLGARVIITSSDDAKLERMRALGADDTINYRQNPDWWKEVLSKTGGRGADVILNNVGASELDSCLYASASGARICFIGNNPVAAGRKAEAPKPLTRLPLLIIRDLTLKGIVVGSRRMFEDLIKSMVQNNIKPVIDRVYGFDQVREAYEYVIAGAKIGKVVIRIQ
jgi:NADPH:quinone reductase-like Zn-dependent oxidoreductase